jgi:hypothetical protein
MTLLSEPLRRAPFTLVWRRLFSSPVLYCFILAASSFAVLAARVHGNLERVRFRVPVGQQAGEQSLDVHLPDLSQLTVMPAALVLRLRGMSEPVSATVTIDGGPVTRVVIPQGREVRVDAPVDVPPGREHVLRIDADRAGWELTYLEIANIYGYSAGILSFVVVPRERPASDRVSPWVLVPFVLAVAVLHPRANWPQVRGRRLLYCFAVGAVLTLFAAVLLVEMFTQYRVLLSPATFFLCFVLLYADPLTRVTGRYQLHVGVLVVVLWGVGQFYRHGTGFTSLILFGDVFAERALPALQRTSHHVEEGFGYDGQYYAQLALDPLLRSEAIGTALDSAGYRGRRILLPWAAHVLGLGRPWYILQAYALLNVIAWGLLAWLLLRWLPAGTTQANAVWAACLLNEGLLTSLRHALPDGPSALLLAAGVVAIERKREWLAAVVLGMSGLARETNIIGTTVLIGERPAPRTIVRLSLRVIVAAAPLLMWIAYLNHRQFSPSDTGYSNFSLPFAAYVWKWRATVGQLAADGWGSNARFSLLSLVGLTTQAGFLLWRRDWQNPWWRVGIAYVGLWTVLGPAVWDGNPGAVTRVVFPMAVAFNVLLPGTRRFWPLWVLGNVNVLHGLQVIRVPWFLQMW